MRQDGWFSKFGHKYILFTLLNNKIHIDVRSKQRITVDPIDIGSIIV